MTPRLINPEPTTMNGATMTQIAEREARSTASQAAILAELNRCGGSASVRDLGRRTGRSTRSIGVLLYGMQNRGEITTSNHGKERIVALPARRSAAMDLPISATSATLGAPYWTSVDNAVSFLCGAVLSTNPAVSDTIRRAAKMIRDDRAMLLAEIQSFRPTVVEAFVEASALPAKITRMREDEGRARIIAAIKGSERGLTTNEVRQIAGLSAPSCKTWLRNAVSAGVLSVVSFRERRNVYGMRA